MHGAEALRSLLTSVTVSGVPGVLYLWVVPILAPFPWERMPWSRASSSRLAFSAGLELGVSPALKLAQASEAHAPEPPLELCRWILALGGSSCISASSCMWSRGLSALSAFRLSLLPGHFWFSRAWLEHHVHAAWPLPSDEDEARPASLVVGVDERWARGACLGLRRCFSYRIKGRHSSSRKGIGKGGGMTVTALAGPLVWWLRQPDPTRPPCSWSPGHRGLGNTPSECAHPGS